MTAALASRAFLISELMAGTVLTHSGVVWQTAVLMSNTSRAVLLGSTETATSAGIGGMASVLAAPDATAAPDAAGLAEADPAAADAAGLAEAEVVVAVPKPIMSV